MTPLAKPVKVPREPRRLKRGKPPARRPMVARTRRPLGTVRREAMAAGDLTVEQWAAICDFYREGGWVWCAYCERKLAAERDHVKPISRGGLHTAANVVPSCGRCNAEKGTSPYWAPKRRHPFMEPDTTNDTGGRA